VLEPPEPDAQVGTTYAPSPARFSSDDLALIEQTVAPSLSERTPLLHLGKMADSYSAQTVELANQCIVRAAIQGVQEQLAPYDDHFAQVYGKCRAALPLRVIYPDSGDYYVVPFQVRSSSSEVILTGGESVKPLQLANIKDVKVDTTALSEMPAAQVAQTMVVVLIDALDGHFMEASWVQEPMVYPRISRKQALQKAQAWLNKQNIGPQLMDQGAKVDLYQHDGCLYHPSWRVTIGPWCLLVDQDGTVRQLKKPL